MAGPTAVAVQTEKALGMYEMMLRIREFEEKAAQLFQQGKLPGFLHSSVGQEAVAVGVIAALRRDDYVTSTHRGHGHVVAKGADLVRMFAELYGKATGYCRGKGGSMHIMDFSLGILGANGIVGGGIPIAVGAGLSVQLRRTDQVVACFFGDGAANNGAFHEGLNLAAIWELPVVFVCENNQYAESTPQRTSARVPLHQRAAAYGMPGEALDGNDVEAVYEAACRAVARARQGEGPTLLVCDTYRWYGHYVGDPAVYRPAEEVEAWKQRDPVARYARRLVERGVATPAELEAIRAKVVGEVDEAARTAETHPDPDPGSIFEDIYAP